MMITTEMEFAGELGEWEAPPVRPHVRAICGEARRIRDRLLTLKGGDRGPAIVHVRKWLRRTSNRWPYEALRQLTRQDLDILHGCLQGVASAMGEEPEPYRRLRSDIGRLLGVPAGEFEGEAELGHLRRPRRSELEDELEGEALELEPFFSRAQRFTEKEWGILERPQGNAFRPPLAPMLAFAGGRATPRGSGGGGATSVTTELFPTTAPALALVDNGHPGFGSSPNTVLNTVMSALAANPATKNLCIAIVDLQAPPTGRDGIYQGLNDDDMLFVGSLQKISPMYAAFELKARVQQHVTAALAGGKSTSAADWKKSSWT